MRLGTSFKKNKRKKVNTSFKPAYTVASSRTTGTWHFLIAIYL